MMKVTPGKTNIDVGFGGKNMKDRKNGKLCFIVIFAAAVAALTTLAVLLMRARAKKRALGQYNDPINCDFDDDCGCCCGCDDDYDCGCEADEEDKASEAQPAEEVPAAE